MKKMLDQQYEKMNSKNHLTDVNKHNASDGITAKPDVLSSVHTIIAGIEKEA